MDIQDKVDLSEWNVWAIHVLKSLERLEKEHKEFVGSHDEVHEKLVEKIDHLKEFIADELRRYQEKEAAQRLEDARSSVKDKVEQAKLNTDMKVKLMLIVGGVSILFTGVINFLIRLFFND